VAVDVSVKPEHDGRPYAGDVVVVGMGAGDVPIFVLGADKHIGSARVPDEVGLWRVTFEVPSLPPLNSKITLAVSILDPSTGLNRGTTRFYETIAITGRHSTGIVELMQHATVERTGGDGTQP
jgi:hypothetical protein